MIEGLWLLLAICGLRSRAARPFVFVLLTNWLFIYLAVALTDGHRFGYASAIALDLWALLACYHLYTCAPSRPRWVQILIGGYALSLLGQVAYWSADALGWYAGVELFWFARVVFTGQMLAVSYPGGLDLVRDVCRLHPPARARSALGRVCAFVSHRRPGGTPSDLHPRMQQDPRS